MEIQKSRGAAAVLAIAVAAGVAGAGSAEADAGTGGRQARVRRGCAHCHEENDLHLKKVPPNLRGLFSRNTLPDGEPATDAEVVRVLMAGKGMMPSFAYQITRPQVDALLAYLHTGLRDEQRDKGGEDEGWGSWFGRVGQTLAAGFASHGHQTMIGTRDPAKLSEWREGTPRFGWAASATWRRLARC